MLTKRTVQFFSAFDIIDITSELPIRKNPFIAFKTVDKTFATHNKNLYMAPNAYYLANVNNEWPYKKWSIQKHGNTFYLKSKDSSIKPGVPHDIVVSFHLVDD